MRPSLPRPLTALPDVGAGVPLRPGYDRRPS